MFRHKRPPRGGDRLPGLGRRALAGSQVFRTKRRACNENRSIFSNHLAEYIWMCLESISMTIESAGDTKLTENSSMRGMTSLCLSDVRPSIIAGLRTRVSIVLSSGDLVTGSELGKMLDNSESPKLWQTGFAASCYYDLFFIKNTETGHKHS